MDDWRLQEVWEEYVASGLSVAAFARSRHVSEELMRGWLVEFASRL